MDTNISMILCTWTINTWYPFNLMRTVHIFSQWYAFLCQMAGFHSIIFMTNKMNVIVGMRIFIRPRFFFCFFFFIIVIIIICSHATAEVDAWSFAVIALPFPAQWALCTVRVSRICVLACKWAFYSVPHLKMDAEEKERQGEICICIVKTKYTQSGQQQKSIIIKYKKDIIILGLGMIILRDTIHTYQ